MAFDINYMARVSSSGNTDALKVWTYDGLSDAANDTVAEITASGYFNNFMQNLTDGIGPLAIGDTIIVSGSDGNGMYKVSDVTTNVEVVAFAAANAIDTANLVDGAVTNAKLAADAVDTSNIVNNAVTSAKVALNMLQYATVAITAAQFNGMYAAPKLLVAAPGANKLLVLDKVDLLMTYVSAAYAAGGVAAVQYDSTANGAGVIASTTLSAATFQATVSTGFMFNTGVVAQTFSTCVNKGLYLSNITQAFTTGDSTFVAHIWYKVIATV
jgi:hypothetical protein